MPPRVRNLSRAAPFLGPKSRGVILIASVSHIDCRATPFSGSDRGNEFGRGHEGIPSIATGSVRGDCGFGNEPIMREAEQRSLAYVFKLRLTSPMYARAS